MAVLSAPFLPSHSHAKPSLSPHQIPRISSWKRWNRAPRIRALREWREYEDAVRDKDLGKALRFLKSVEAAVPLSTSSLSSTSMLPPYSTSGLLPRAPERDWEVLDTCLNADDMRLVGSAYAFLQDRGFLPNFGKCRNIVLEGTRDVTPAVLKESTGLEATKLSPKKWGVSGSSRAVLIAFLGGVSFLLSKEIDIRPNLAAILALATLDAVFLGGSCLAQISCLWPPHKRRILVHEAGHLLTAYLMGCPIRGVILDPIVAMQMGIKGQVIFFFYVKGMFGNANASWDSATSSQDVLWKKQCKGCFSKMGEISCLQLIVSGAPRKCSAAVYLMRDRNNTKSRAGTQFWDEKLENELAEGRLSGTAFDRYCMVLFAGIAAEALVYGEAEGGENDENLFRSICVLLRPPLSISQMSNQARWSVLQSYNLLKWHKQAHRVVVKALESGCSLSVVIRRIEAALASNS